MHQILLFLLYIILSFAKSSVHVLEILDLVLSIPLLLILVFYDFVKRLPFEDSTLKFLRLMKGEGLPSISYYLVRETDREMSAELIFEEVIFRCSFKKSERD